jgi:hypothetical protein
MKAIRVLAASAFAGMRARGTKSAEDYREAQKVELREISLRSLCSLFTFLRLGKPPILGRLATKSGKEVMRPFSGPSMERALLMYFAED